MVIILHIGSINRLTTTVDANKIPKLQKTEFYQFIKANLSEKEINIYSNSYFIYLEFIRISKLNDAGLLYKHFAQVTKDMKIEFKLIQWERTARLVSKQLDLYTLDNVLSNGINDENK